MPSLLTPQIITLIVVLLFALAAVAIVSVAGLKARRAALELIQRAIDKGSGWSPMSSRRSRAGSPRVASFRPFWRVNISNAWKLRTGLFACSLAGHNTIAFHDELLALLESEVRPRLRA